MLCVHTFSASDLSWHPHVHGVVMAGVFAEDGRFIRCTREDLAEHAQERLEQAVLEMLGKEVPQLEGTLDRMQTWEHSGFGLYLGKVIEAYDKPATQNLTEYILRPSFSLGALEVDEQRASPSTNDFRTTDSGKRGERRSKRATPSHVGVQRLASPRFRRAHPETHSGHLLDAIYPMGGRVANTSRPGSNDQSRC